MTDTKINTDIVSSDNLASNPEENIQEDAPFLKPALPPPVFRKPVGLPKTATLEVKPENNNSSEKSIPDENDKPHQKQSKVLERTKTYPLPYKVSI